METPIAYDKLAREDRFVRMRTRDFVQFRFDASELVGQDRLE